MKSIGGYFEIETMGIGNNPHNDGILLNSGRNSLEYILRSIDNIKHIYIPYYTCEVVLEPLNKLGIPYTFYHINLDFEIIDLPILKRDEYIVVNNYYGVKDDYILKFSKYYGDRMIVDATQSLFMPIIEDAKMFFSLRKYIGVPDGGVAYGVSRQLLSSYIKDDSSERIEHLYIRKEFGAEAGYTKYKENEKKLDNLDIYMMSDFTSKMINSINYTSIQDKRIENFCHLHQYLHPLNQITIPDINSFACPMIYPLCVESAINIRTELIKNKIFVAKYWPNVEEWAGENALETWMANNILPLPIDQRYGVEDMNRIIKIIING